MPNGVDVESYRRVDALPAGADWSRLPITLLYPGLFNYLPNEDAAIRLIKEVLPAVRARGRAARVVLVGRNPTPSLLEAARHDPGVEVTGAVESVVPYLEQPCVVTLPIAIASGTRLKILEAFAVGRPVVSSAKGAEGIDAVDGEHLLIRETPDSMAAAVIDLWNRPVLRSDSLRERARTGARSLLLVDRRTQDRSEPGSQPGGSALQTHRMAGDASGAASVKRADRRVYFYLIFFAGGLPALIYQVTWQRVLTLYFGVDIYSTTVTVATFMLGLGVGSLCWRLDRRPCGETCAVLRRPRSPHGLLWVREPLDVLVDRPAACRRLAGSRDPCRLSPASRAHDVDGHDAPAHVSSCRWQRQRHRTSPGLAVRREYVRGSAGRASVLLSVDWPVRTGWHHSPCCVPQCPPGCGRVRRDGVGEGTSRTSPPRNRKPAFATRRPLRWDTAGF